MDKYEFFPRPTTYKEIIGNRELVQVTKDNLVQRIESLDRQNQAILVDFPIVPGGYGSYPFFEDWMNFLKRGPEVHLRVPTVSDSIEKRIGPTRLRIEAVERIDQEGSYCGYVWYHQTARMRSKVHLVDCIDSAKLLAFTKKSGKDIMKVTPYIKTTNVRELGGGFEVQVPSRSTEEPRPVLLLSFPLPKTPEKYSVWTNLRADHYCPQGFYYALHFRGKIPTKTFCPHEIAAYLRVADYIYHGEGEAKAWEGRLTLLPFALPTQLTVNFYNASKNNVMIAEERTRTIKGRKVKKLIKRPLNRAELEILLWKFVATKKDEKGRLHRPTLFTKTKLVDYNWD